MKKFYILPAVLLIVIAGFLISKSFSSSKSEITSSNNLQNQMQSDTNSKNQKLNSDVQIHPISHASIVITWGNKTIFVDPVGDASLYKNFPTPDYILITHFHPDHFDPKTLSAVSGDDTTLFVPPSVRDDLNKTPNIKIKGGFMIMDNNVTTSVGDQKISVQAIPAYNIIPEQQMFHPKGRDNGYILESEGFRVYIAGDTSGTPEMRALKNIDIAFVPMNMPYTMTVDEAASAVLDFKPKQVWPYHYREGSKYSDINKFKELVNKGNPNIEVVFGKWY